MTPAPPAPPAAKITVRDLTLAYGTQVILHDLNFEVHHKDIFVIIGGSGCGKSTLLRHLIGLLEPARGAILYDGQDMTATDPGERAAFMRRFGVMYQSGALWSSLTLAENIALPLQEAGPLPARTVRELVAYKLALVGLAGFEQSYPAQLSGGMKQQSLLTGKLYIEFDIVPDGPFFVYQPGAPTPYPTVPTIGTAMDELISGVADGLKKFNSLDLDSVVKELRAVLSNAKDQIAALEVKKINDNLVGITADVHLLTSNAKLATAVDRLDAALAGIDELAQKANQGIDPLLKDLEKITQQTQAGLAKIDEATTDLSKMANPRGPVLMRLQNVLEQTERGARAMMELATDLKRNPNALLLGKDHKP